MEERESWVRRQGGVNSANRVRKVPVSEAEPREIIKTNTRGVSPAVWG